MPIQQEIAEALRIGATRCEDLRDSWESEHTVDHLGDEACKLRQLASRVEAARCETCTHYKYSSDGYCESSSRLMAVNDFCWLYKEKVK